eukprot:SAG11_NODE_61_length_19011_cov_49.624048_7_plen_240_part_00
MFSQVVAVPPDAIFDISTRYKADAAELKLNLGVGAYRAYRCALARARLCLQNQYHTLSSPRLVCAGTDEGDPLVLNVVKKAEAILLEKHAGGQLNKEYLPIDGYADVRQQQLNTPRPPFVFHCFFFFPRCSPLSLIYGLESSLEGSHYAPLCRLVLHRCRRQFREGTLKLILGSESPSINEGRVACCQSLSGTGALRIGGVFVANNLGADRTVYLCVCTSALATSEVPCVCDKFYAHNL